MEKKTSVIYEAYDNTVVFCGYTEDCDKWIGEQARKYNYNRLRTWKENGKTYYDVGPSLYYICD